MSKSERETAARERQLVVDAVVDGRISRDMGWKLLVSTGLDAESCNRILEGRPHLS